MTDLLIDQITQEQFINIIANKSSIESIDDYIETEIKDTGKGKTYKSYRDNFHTFKNYVGFRGKKMRFKDITPSLLKKFKQNSLKEILVKQTNLKTHLILIVHN